MNHLTIRQLLEYGLGDPPDDVRAHLDTCAACRQRMSELAAVDSALRDISDETTSPGFTELVMEKARIRTSTGPVWSMFNVFAPFLALIAVGVIAVGAMQYYGVFQGSALGQSASDLQSVSGRIGSHFGNGLTAFSLWTKKYLSFAFAKGSYGITALVVCLLGAVALVDKFVFEPRMRKRGM